MKFKVLNYQSYSGMNIKVYKFFTLCRVYNKLNTYALSDSYGIGKFDTVLFETDELPTENLEKHLFTVLFSVIDVSEFLVSVYDKGFIRGEVAAQAKIRKAIGL